jgi:hypothetical protein
MHDPGTKVYYLNYETWEAASQLTLRAEKHSRKDSVEANKRLFCLTNPEISQNDKERIDFVSEGEQSRKSIFS